MSTTIEIQFDKKIDNSRLRRDADSLCRLEYFCLTLLGAIFVCGALFYAWQQYQWIQYGYHIEEAQERIEALVEDGRRLRVEREMYESPQRVEDIARHALGMIGPRAEQIVTLEGGYGVPVDRGINGTQVASRQE